ncbi:hypothetical protein KPH14_006514 [Odynerus spinipes]|uniref:Transferrin n=1 Tax=Odynerus spinipes TaxID=1348599 RepID=A0AAD9RQM4_9HYME|nr:hypothetical protein KPH14_006514 [Odynerus spinipes]
MRTLFLVILAAVSTYAKQKYKFCAPNSIDDGTCAAIQRGDSQVTCLRVSDDAECAIRLANGEADFGMFSTDALLLTCQYYPNEIVPIFELRHKDKSKQEFEFQSVAVVPADFKPVKSGSTFANLKDAGLCHPGFSKAQWWNDYILKYFERNTYNANCQKDITAIENELENIKSFFGKACRPGDWAAESNFSNALKKKYPELCALCDDTTACKYNNEEKHGHVGALNCLTSGRGKVAYVALEYVRQYFKENETAQYQFLCPDGSLQNLTSNAPCAWVKQPWGAIAARKQLATNLTQDLNSWLGSPTSFAAESWTESLNRVIQEDSIVTDILGSTSLLSYLARGRKDVQLSDVQSCGNVIRWCTMGSLETAKCEWIAKQAIALGIEPKISCWQNNSTFGCFRDIADNRADIMTIDSNYGYIARQAYGLTPILYTEINEETSKNNMIMAVLRKPENDNYTIKNFHQLKGRTACFPEYGGIAWLSFIKVARMNHIFSTDSCDYPGLLDNLLSGACTPGIEDPNRVSHTINSTIVSKLCSVCPHENGIICSLNDDNRYYGDEGALTCLNEGAGDIAFVEIGNIREEKNDFNRYRVLCKNGSLAATTGFNLDKPEHCALSVIVDSEVVVRRNNTEIDTLNTVLSLLKLEDWLGYRVYSSRVLHVYGKFNNTDDLLFKSSTIGLVPATSKIESVLAHKELFSHIDDCTSAGSFVIANVTLITLVVMFFFSMN